MDAHPSNGPVPRRRCKPRARTARRVERKTTVREDYLHDAVIFIKGELDIRFSFLPVISIAGDIYKDLFNRQRYGKQLIRSAAGTFQLLLREGHNLIQMLLVSRYGKMRLLRLFVVVLLPQIPHAQHGDVVKLRRPAYKCTDGSVQTADQFLRIALSCQIQRISQAVFPEQLLGRVRSLRHAVRIFKQAVSRSQLQFIFMVPQAILEAKRRIMLLMHHLKLPAASSDRGILMAGICRDKSARRHVKYAQPYRTEHQ